MSYWMMKSEPSAYSWDQLVTDKRTGWSGIRNHLANNNMKAMKVGDKAFFYHSNEDKAVIGVMKIVGLWRLDPSDSEERFGMVDVAPEKTLERPVTLAEIKADKALKKMVFVKQGRLSVSPVTPAEWERILELAAVL
jgi:predicted RNA-binding protein with PUA-like domain